MESKAMETGWNWNYTAKPHFTLNHDHNLPVSQVIIHCVRFFSLKGGGLRTWVECLESLVLSQHILCALEMPFQH